MRGVRHDKSDLLHFSFRIRSRMVVQSIWIFLLCRGNLSIVSSFDCKIPSGSGKGFFPHEIALCTSDLWRRLFFPVRALANDQDHGVFVKRRPQPRSPRFPIRAEGTHSGPIVQCALDARRRPGLQIGSRRRICPPFRAQGIFRGLRSWENPLAYRRACKTKMVADAMCRFNDKASFRLGRQLDPLVNGAADCAMVSLASVSELTPWATRGQSPSAVSSSQEDRRRGRLEYSVPSP